MINLIFANIEMQFLVNLLFCIFAGFIIGIERESRGKDAGISTHIFVIAGAMLFSFLSGVQENGDVRIASQIVVGIGFLGAGLILKEGERVINLTTAASIWFTSGIGMAIGFGFYFVAFISCVAAVLVPKIPHVHPKSPESIHNNLYKINKK